ncbi:MAG: hypothetical protein HYT40_00720 [Candidatus Sungbacteria bacterium]|uniref:Uncharacterized protein n=1 Tax=Candidatus Sungiibacteriota bacterium TaxID=2750080 RepID=A0A931WP82_9BACT|nr:hypothetical protein [Candidatus Sungbacteria bacterium]
MEDLRWYGIDLWRALFFVLHTLAGLFVAADAAHRATPPGDGIAALSGLERSR